MARKLVLGGDESLARFLDVGNRKRVHRIRGDRFCPHLNSLDGLPRISRSATGVAVSYHCNRTAFVRLALPKLLSPFFREEFDMSLKRFAAYGLSLAALLAFFAVPAVAQNAPKKAKAPDPAFAKITDDPKLPRVLLIGDSISIGYTLATRAQLKDIANVHRIPVNGGPTHTAVDKIDSWLGDTKWDVIHFNWGLHDLKQMDGKHQVPLKDYEANLRKLVERMSKTGATLVWCSTTPVPEGKLEPPRSNKDVQEYNAVAKKIMDENKIAIDDLYAFALPQLTSIQRPVNVHFTPEGSAVLAKQVSSEIKKALAQRKPASP
jgi:acyl-CoA thioesterase-1